MKRSILSLLVLAASADAGGFWLGTQAPKSADAAAVGVVMGCEDPARAQLTAKAEGFVEGKRVTVPLDVRPKGKGFFEVVKKSLPTGKWVLALTATSGELVTSEIVPLSAEGTIAGGGSMKPGKYTHRALDSTDLESALR